MINSHMTKDTLNVSQDVLGLPVISQLSKDYGKVVDVIVHPTCGRMLGMIVRDKQGGNRLISADEVFIYAEEEAVISETKPQPASNQKMLLTGASISDELIGCGVVTLTGHSLGTVSEAYLDEMTNRIIYRVSESKMQAWMGAGFMMPGDAPISFARRQSLLIVPDGLAFISRATTKMAYSFMAMPRPQVAI